MNNVKNTIGVSEKRLQKGLYWERAWSLVDGCTPVSEGCANCWSATQSYMRKFQEKREIEDRYSGLTDDKGRWMEEIRLNYENGYLPWNVKKPTIFAIWNDLFHPDVPEIFQDETFSVMGCQESPNIVDRHTFLILTKRPDNMRKYIESRSERAMGVTENILFGATVEMNKYRWRIDELLKIPNVSRFVSIEPCLEDIDMTDYLWTPLSKPDGTGKRTSDLKNEIDWIIVGAESGSNKRECKTEWVRNIVEQCGQAGVPVFVKQLHIDGKLVKDIDKFPEDLRIRQLPF